MHCTALRVLIWLSEAVNQAVNRNAKRAGSRGINGIKRYPAARHALASHHIKAINAIQASATLNAPVSSLNCRA